MGQLYAWACITTKHRQANYIETCQKGIWQKSKGQSEKKVFVGSRHRRSDVGNVWSLLSIRLQHMSRPSHRNYLRVGRSYGCCCRQTCLLLLLLLLFLLLLPTGLLIAGLTASDDALIRAPAGEGCKINWTIICAWLCGPPVLPCAARRNPLSLPPDVTASFSAIHA